MTHQGLPPRHTYLLRIWGERTGESEQPVYRFSLQDVRAGQRQGFASLADLIAYLHARLESAALEDGQPPGPMERSHPRSP